LLTLVGAKVKEPQGYPAGPIRQHNDKHGASSADDGGMFDAALDQDALAGLATTYRVNARAVFIAAWQVK
jgi:hypothetical protein